MSMLKMVTDVEYSSDVEDGGCCASNALTLARIPPDGCVVVVLVGMVVAVVVVVGCVAFGAVVVGFLAGIVVGFGVVVVVVGGCHAFLAQLEVFVPLLLVLKFVEMVQ